GAGDGAALHVQGPDPYGPDGPGGHPREGVPDRPQMRRGVQEVHEDRVRRDPPQVELYGRPSSRMRSGCYSRPIPKSGLARVGQTTPKQLGAVTVHRQMVTSVQTRTEPRGYFPDASVDPTEARNAPAFRQARGVAPWFAVPRSCPKLSDGISRVVRAN